MATAETDRHLALKSLYEFVQQAWPVVEPAMPFIDAWHIEAICQHLEAVTRGDILRLLINIPPGHAKSLLVCVFWPAWIWLHKPHWRGLFGSYSMDLSVRDSVRCRDLIASDWYQDTFRPTWRIKSDQNVKTHFENDASGFRFALAVGTRGLGFRGDLVAVDDPLNAQDQQSKVARESVIWWWDKVMSSRLNDHKKGAKVIIGQRLHEEDLSGHVIKQGGYEQLVLPSEFEPDRVCRTSLFTDPRTQEGELLFPKLYPREVLNQALLDLASDGYAGQHQQRPAPAEGSQFKRQWFRYYTLADGCLILDSGTGQRRVVKLSDCRRFTTADLATSIKTTADFTVICAWALTPASDLVLLDMIRDRVEAPGIIPLIAMLGSRWECQYAAIESVGFQLSIVQAARQQGLTVRELKADRDKISRSTTAVVKMESGGIWFPQEAPWLPDLEAELLVFPNGKNDDIVDNVSYASIEVNQLTARPRLQLL